MRPAPLALCLALLGCTQFPELEGTVAPDVETAAYPDLVPLGPLLANSAPVVEDPVATTDALESRVTALRARAGALQRGTIVDSATRTRLSNPER